MGEHNQQFDNFQQWVNKAPSWLTRYEGKAICFDSKGRHVTNGGGFMQARDEDAFPVRWVWDWQVAAYMPKLMSEDAEGWIKEATRLAQIAEGYVLEEGEP